MLFADIDQFITSGQALLAWVWWVCRKGQVRTTPHLKPIQDTKYQGYVIGYCDCEGVSLFLNFELCLNLFKSTMHEPE